MKRQRRNFTKEFKTQVVNSILNKQLTRKQISDQHQISLPLIERWMNDYLAKDKLPESSEYHGRERRKNPQGREQYLKAKIADLYLYIDKLKSEGLTYRSSNNPSKEM